MTRVSLRDQIRAADARSQHWQDLAKRLGEKLDRTQEQWADRALRAESFLREVGYRKCDVAACNCGSWHKDSAA